MASTVAIFEALEWVFAVSGVVGGAFAVIAALEAYADYLYAPGKRVRAVAWKNVATQSAIAAALIIIGAIGILSIYQPPTTAQLRPVLQTWVFYYGMTAAALVLAGGSVYGHHLYRKLVITAETGGQNGSRY